MLQAMFSLKEKDIIKLLRKGERDKAINLLYKLVYPNVRKYVLNHGGIDEDARDFFQESVMVFFQNIFQKKITLDDDFNVGGYLMNVVKHKLVDKQRKDKKIDFTDEFNSYDSSDTELVVTEQIHNKELSSTVNAVLESVGERCAQLLKVVILYDMSLKEAATKLGYSGEGSAKTQIFKCRQKLILKYKDNIYLKNLLKSVDE